MDYQHFHLWKAGTDSTFKDLERYTQAHKEDDHCLIKCLRREADTLNVELVLVDEREAFVILPPGGSRKNSCTAYHLTGRSVVQPLVELYKQWWNSDSDKIKDPYQVYEQELKKLYEKMFPPPVQAPDLIEMAPPSAQAAGPSVEELEEDEFWTRLIQALRDLATSQQQSAIFEVRLSHAISPARQEECDAAIVDALGSGKVNAYCRAQVVMTEDEVSRLEAFIAGHNREKNHTYKTMSVFVSVKPSQHYLDPWTFWLLEPGKVVYLWCPGDNESLPSCCSLVIREPSLVKGFHAYFNTWWANRPRQVTIHGGPACDQGAFKKESFGTWRRHLTG